MSSMILKFGEWDRSCQDQARCGRPSFAGSETRHQTMKTNTNPAVPELAKSFNVYQATVERWMEALNFTWKLYRSVPYQRTADQRKKRIVACIFMHPRYKNEPLLTRIVTGEVKCGIYCTVMNCVSAFWTACIYIETTISLQKCFIQFVKNYAGNYSMTGRFT